MITFAKITSYVALISNQISFKIRNKIYGFVNSFKEGMHWNWNGKVTFREEDFHFFGLNSVQCNNKSQQTNVIERGNRILIDMMRSMISNSSVPLINWWSEALTITVYILNRIPSKEVSKTPFELWNGEKSTLKYLHIWSCWV